MFTERTQRRPAQVVKDGAAFSITLSSSASLLTSLMVLFALAFLHICSTTRAAFAIKKDFSRDENVFRASEMIFASTNSWPTTLGHTGFAPNFGRTLYAGIQRARIC